MERLIRQIEATTGPDRFLDGQIATAVDLPVPRDPVGWPPAFTASVDAAVTLVPSDRSWELRSAIPGCADDCCEAECRSWDDDHSISQDCSSGRGATPALALCAAALKAIEWDRSQG
jgi:hypothetical protein